MTYNFDPELWYENHRLLLEERRARGELDAAAFAEASAALDREHQRMLVRLDGTYRLPAETASSGEDHGPADPEPR